MSEEINPHTVDSLMETAQVFASAWAPIGFKFDDG